MTLDKKTLTYHSLQVKWKDTAGNEYCFQEKNIVCAMCTERNVTILRQEADKHERITLKADGTKFFSYVLGGTELIVYRQDEVHKILSAKIWDNVVDRNENIYLLAGDERAVYRYKKETDVIEKYAAAPAGYGLYRIESIDDKILKVVGEDINANLYMRRDRYLSLDLKLKKWEVLGIAY